MLSWWLGERTADNNKINLNYKYKKTIKLNRAKTIKIGKRKKMDRKFIIQNRMIGS